MTFYDQISLREKIRKISEKLLDKNPASNQSKNLVKCKPEFTCSKTIGESPEQYEQQLVES